MSAAPEPATAPAVAAGRWLAARTGAASVARALAVPARGSWWWLGAAIAVGFGLQAATGALLLVHYVPHPDHAFASARAILWKVPFGWLVRLFHAQGASVLLLLGATHTIVSALRADYKAPRELVWLCGRSLLLLGLAAAVSGYVLPWSQLSYWATTITTSPLEKLPRIGPTLTALARGGASVGGPTLSRAFVAHVALLPMLLAAGLALHGWLLRQAPAPGAMPGRPAARAIELAMIVVAYGALLLALSVFAPGLAFPPHADAPADPLETPMPIRPEWYLLWASALQALLPEAAGLGLVALLPLLLLAVPFLDRRPERALRRRPLALAVIGGVLLGLVLLSAAGARAENGPPSQCIACHEADEDELVSACVREWRASVHAEADVSCDGCHGGDPLARDEDDAHDEAAGWVGSPAWRAMPGFCGGCHEAVAEGFEAGSFGPARFTGDAFPPSCATCHLASGHDTQRADARELLPDPLPERLRLAPVPEMQALVHPLAERERILGDALAALERRALPPTGFARELAAIRGTWTPRFHRFEPAAFPDDAARARDRLDALDARVHAAEIEAGVRVRVGAAGLGLAGLGLAALAALRRRLAD